MIDRNTKSVRRGPVTNKSIRDVHHEMISRGELVIHHGMTDEDFDKLGHPSAITGGGDLAIEFYSRDDVREYMVEKYQKGAEEPENSSFSVGRFDLCLELAVEKMPIVLGLLDTQIIEYYDRLEQPVFIGKNARQSYARHVFTNYESIIKSQWFTDEEYEEVKKHVNQIVDQMLTYRYGNHWLNASDMFNKVGSGFLDLSTDLDRMAFFHIGYQSFVNLYEPARREQGLGVLLFLVTDKADFLFTRMSYSYMPLALAPEKMADYLIENMNDEVQDGIGFLVLFVVSEEQIPMSEEDKQNYHRVPIIIKNYQDEGMNLYDVSLNGMTNEFVLKQNRRGRNLDVYPMYENDGTYVGSETMWSNSKVPRKPKRKRK